MEVSYTPLSEVTDGVRLKGTYTPGAASSETPVWNFKLNSTGGDVIYLKVPKSEVAGLLEQLQDIVDNN